ncbi:hypothetical protein ACHAWF_016996, partial [Thalassiosira exigua]
RNRPSAPGGRRGRTERRPAGANGPRPPSRASPKTNDVVFPSPGGFRGRGGRDARGAWDEPRSDPARRTDAARRGERPPASLVRLTTDVSSLAFPASRRAGASEARSRRPTSRPRTNRRSTRRKRTDRNVDGGGSDATLGMRHDRMSEASNRQSTRGPNWQSTRKEESSGRKELLPTSHFRQGSQPPRRALPAVAALAAASRGVLIADLSPFATPPSHRSEEEEAGSRYDSAARCDALARHEAGRWVHRRPSPEVLRDPAVRATHLPAEVEWLAGRDFPPEGWANCTWASSDGGRGTMYRSRLGNQCGACGVRGFGPSLSRWVPAAGGGDDERFEGATTSSPTLRLVRRLAAANATLCLAGDSIDYQFYDALRHNLVRHTVLRDDVEVVLERREVPATYTDETGRPPNDGWATMKSVLETVATLGDGASAAIRYYKSYGWPPWNAAFMEDCHVLVLNLGLHYQHYGNMTGLRWGWPSYADDFRAALTYLVDFVSSKEGRIAVWRSTLPQHFDTPVGHYEEHRTCSLRPLNHPDRKIVQEYNRATERGFVEMCDNPEEERTEDMGSHCDGRLRGRACAANVTSVAYRTVYRHLSEHNCTGRLGRYREMRANATGRILRWDVADLFDVPRWHAGLGGDCSHFCYVPPLFEAAFERLELLLPPLRLHPGR